jgi:hypothetical protein
MTIPELTRDCLRRDYASAKRWIAARLATSEDAESREHAAKLEKAASAIEAGLTPNGGQHDE